MEPKTAGQSPPAGTVVGMIPNSNCLMKKSIYTLLGIAAIVAGCTKEIESSITETSEPGKVAVTILASTPETKTTASIEGNTAVYSWTVDDVIGVVEEDAEEAVSFTINADGLSTGAFTGTLTEGKAPVFAVSPAGALTSATDVGGELQEYTITLPATYDNYVSGTTNAVMIGTPNGTEDGKYKFRFDHTAAVIQVTYANVPVGTYGLNLTTDKNINGSYTFDAVSGVTLGTPEEGTTTTTIRLTEAVSESNQTLVFYVPVPAAEYETFSIALIDASEEVIAGTAKTKSSTTTLAAGDMFVTPAIELEYFTKITSTANLMNGTYLIVYEGNESHDAVAFNGSLATLDAANNGVAVGIINGQIVKTTALAADTFTISIDDGTILSASGKYIGVSTNSTGLKTATDVSTYTNSFSIDDSKNAVISAVFSDSNMSLRYNYAINQTRFRYYASGQQPIALYLLDDGTGTTPKAAPGLEYETTSYEVKLGESFSAPTLTNPHGLTVTYASSATDIATVDSSTGAVTLVAAGSTTITATFEGNDSYKAGSASYTLTVTPAAASTVSEILADGAGTYDVENLLVYAVNGNYVIVGDNSGKMLLYKSSHGLSVGDNISISMATVIDYNGILQITDGTFSTNSSGNTVDHGTAVELNVAENATSVQSTFSDSGYHSAQYVSMSGAQSGRYVNGGAKLYLNVANTQYDGKSVIVTGYVYYYNSTYTSFNFQLLTIVQNPAVADLDVKPTSLSWTAGECGSENAKTITVTLNDNASGYMVSYTDTNNEWSVSDNGSGTITVYPLDANESESDPKELEITITHDDDSSLTETVTLTQAKVTEAPTSVSYDFTESDWTVSNGTLSNGTVSFTGEGAGTKANFRMSSGYFILGQSGAYITFPTYSYPVTKIEVTGRTGASGSVKQNIYVGTTAVSTETTGATGTNTYNIDSNYQSVGTTYILKVTSSHNTQITKIEVFFN